MATLVREMCPEDARTFLEVHRASVRGLAAGNYPATVIEAWAPLPITDITVESFLVNTDREIRLLAEREGEIIGIGALVVEKSELRACYVLPAAARTGIGSAIVREIERIARRKGLVVLRLIASVNSELFYLAQGYRIEERGEHNLQSGHRMACVKMLKIL